MLYLTQIIFFGANMKEFIINQNDANQRVDKFVTKAVPRLPKSLLYKFLRLKRIKLNGKKCEISTRLNVGDVISMYINDEFFETDDNTAFLSVPDSIDVVYEDENILLINKPAGLVVHEDDNNTSDTLINRILHYLYNKKEYNPSQENSFTPALCNRIDRNTCGIVIAAKTAAALRILNDKIKNREIQKTYLCAVNGSPTKKSATLKHYLKKDENKKLVSVFNSPQKDAKTAITEYKVLKSNGNISLLEIDLKTGRTHQIRAQLSHIGHPLIGDGKYGSYSVINGKKIKKQALCSYKLKFTFKTDAEDLNYLNGREFSVTDIWFSNLL